MGSKSFPYDSLAQMPIGHFWARSASMGLSEQEAMQIVDNADPQIRDRVRETFRRAAYALRVAEPGYPYSGKPS